MPPAMFHLDVITVSGKKTTAGTGDKEKIKKENTNNPFIYKG